MRRLGGEAGKLRRAVVTGLGVLIPGFLLIAASAASESLFYVGLSAYSLGKEPHLCGAELEKVDRWLERRGWSCPV